MDIKKKIIISGQKVHDVGYRVMLTNKALSAGINNFNTFNTYLNGTQAVIAIIEAEDEVIEEYKNFVNNFFPKKAIVENISFEEYKNSVPPIERVMQAFQMEQWGKAIPILVGMLDKQDKMLDKQDLHMEITRNGFDDLKYEIKTGLHDVKSEIKDVKNEIHMQRDDFKEVFMKEVEGLHNEINEIRATLARMQHGQEV